VLALVDRDVKPLATALDLALAQIEGLCGAPPFKVTEGLASPRLYSSTRYSMSRGSDALRGARYVLSGCVRVLS
jgi:hypothetical protein